MPALKDEVKLFITQCLACYDVPSKVVESVKEEFGLELERSHVQVYDPTKRAGKDLSATQVQITDTQKEEAVAAMHHVTALVIDLCQDWLKQKSRT